jgi:hypothetical protein
MLAAFAIALLTGCDQASHTAEKPLITSSNWEVRFLGLHAGVINWSGDLAARYDASDLQKQLRLVTNSPGAVDVVLLESRSRTSRGGNDGRTIDAGFPFDVSKLQIRDTLRGSIQYKFLATRSESDRTNSFFQVIPRWTISYYIPAAKGDRFFWAIAFESNAIADVKSLTLSNFFDVPPFEVHINPAR